MWRRQGLIIATSRCSDAVVQVWYSYDTSLLSESDASIFTRILGPDPTTFEAYRVHPIVDLTKFLEGVGDAHIAYGHEDHDRNSAPLAAISQPKIHVNALAAAGSAPGPVGGAYRTLPDPLSGFGG